MKGKLKMFYTIQRGILQSFCKQNGLYEFIELILFFICEMKKFRTTK
jgi:hypothetical protein